MDQAKIDELLNSMSKTIEVTCHNLITKTHFCNRQEIYKRTATGEEITLKTKQLPAVAEKIQKLLFMYGMEMSVDAALQLGNTIRQRIQDCKRGQIDCMGFEEFVVWWINTGHIYEQGIGPGKYRMRRIDKNKGYTADNLECKQNQKSEPKVRKDTPIKIATNILAKRDIVLSKEYLRSFTMSLCSLISNARKENIPCMSFEEYVYWWADTGHIHEKGMYEGDYIASRIDKTKGYTADNLKCWKRGRNKNKKCSKHKSDEQ